MHSMCDGPLSGGQQAARSRIQPPNFMIVAVLSRG